MVHTLRLDNYSTTPRKLVLGTNSSFGTESIKIERGAGWDGLNLTATWHIPGREEPLRVALLDGDAMDVPPEVTKEAKDGVLVLAGLASGVQRASCNVEYLILEQAGVYGGTDAEPTPELAAQVLEATMRTKANAEAAAQDASEAKANANMAQQAAENAAADAAKAGPYAEAALSAKEAAEAASDDAQAAARAAKASETAAADSASNAAKSAQAALESKTAAATSEGNAAASAKKAQDISDSLPADYKTMSGDVDTLKNQMQLAYPDNTAPTDATWSARKTLAVLCDEVTASGNPVELEDVCEVEAVASWEPVQEGTGTSSPENIRPIKGRDSVNVELCGENLSITAGLNDVLWATEYTDLLNVLNKLPAGTYVLGFTFTLQRFLSAYTSDTAESIAFRINSRFNDGTNCIVDNGDYITKSKKLPFTKKITKTFVITPQNKGRVKTAYFYACGRDSATDGAPNGALGVGSISNVTITRGTTAPTTYTPYIGQTNTLTLPETVYGGSVDARTGEGQETWKTVTLDGNSNFTERSGKVMFLYNFCDDWNRDRKYLSSHYSPFMGGWDNIPNQSFQIVDNALGIRDDRFTSLDDFKSYIAAQHAAGTPVQICYKLAAPEAIQATGGAALAPVEGKNTVMTDADTLSVTAKKAPLVRLGELRKEYEATVGELETAQRDIRVLKKLSKGQVWDFEEKTEDAYVRQVPAGAYAAGVQTWGGKTVAWNQMLKNAGFAISDGWIPRYSNATFSDGVATIKYTGSNSVSWRLEQSIAYTQNHKYFACADIWNDAVNDTSSSGIFCGSGWAIERTKPTANNWIHLSGIVTYTSGTSEFGIYPNRMDDATGRSSKIKNPVLADLTLMFGTGNEPTTTDDPRIAWIEQYAAAHQEYNAGKLVSAEVNEVQFNGVAVGVVPSAVQGLPGYGWSTGTAKNTVERTADGKWQYVQRVGKVELDGTESLNYYNPVERGLVATIICMPEAMPKEVFGFCSLYKFVKNSVWSGETENCVFFIGDKTLGLSIDLSTATSFGFDGTNGTIPKTVKAMLETYKSRGTPLSITYPLNTPIVTDITDLMGTDALNFEVEPGGSITMHNATELPVPATIQYVEKLSEVVSND